MAGTESKDAQAAARILVVEDEAIIAFCLQETLTRLGYDVVGVIAFGEEALQKVSETPPDLVLMDVQLAGDMDGIEAAAEIQAQFDVPVVYLTGYVKEDTLLQQSKTAAFYYLDKLARDQELQATIEMALQQRKIETQ
jgi:CheY-like chemotaxis protein